MRLVAVCFALVCLLPGLAQASGYSDPKALVEALYSVYRTNDFPEDDRVYYSERLKALFAADDARANGEVGAVNGDPFIYAQDWDEITYSVGEPVATEQGVSISVQFTNFGTPHTAVIYLVEEADGWKVDDILQMPATPGDANWLLSAVLAAEPMLYEPLQTVICPPLFRPDAVAGRVDCPPEM